MPRAGKGLFAMVGAAVVVFGTAAGPMIGNAQGGDVLRIGLLLSLSGPAAPFGIPERDAAELLGQQLNGSGGVNGRKIEFSVYDDSTSPTEAARGATQLIQQNHVVAIIGSTTGSGTLAAAPVAMRYEVPILAPNGTLDVTSKDNKFFAWVFRTLTGDLTNTKVMFDRATAGGAKKVALFYQEDAYGKNTADYLQQLARQAGVEIVDTAAAPLKALDLTAQATKLRNANPEIVLIQVSAPALGAAFVRAAEQVGLKVPMWGPIGLGQKAFLEGAGSAAENVKLVLVVNWDDPPAGLQKLGDILRAGGKKPEGFGEVISTNGLLTIVAAAKSISGEVTGAKLRDAIEKVCGLKTYGEGTLCYKPDDHDGWSPDLLTTVVVKNGKFQRVE
jgi:branched-chain amino acid transport system substrate-binding protein